MAKSTKLGCSYITRNKLAESLKELMEKELFEKLSVSDITSNCGFHRQTFYYHFEDKYELLDWIIQQELIDPFIKDFRLENICSKLYNMFSVMSNNKRFYQNALKINTEELSRYISKIAYGNVVPVIKSIELARSLGPTDEANEAIVAEFLSYGITGVIICWVQRGMKDTPEVMTKRIEKILIDAQRLNQSRV